MADALKIRPEIPLHFHSNPILHQILLLGYSFGRQSSDAFLGKLAVGRTTKIHFGIGEPVAAFFAFAGRVVLEKFYYMAALGAFFVKNGPRFPVSTVLSGTLHNLPSTAMFLTGLTG
jgi:hypothetical protein